MFNHDSGQSVEVLLCRNFLFVYLSCFMLFGISFVSQFMNALIFFITNMFSSHAFQLLYHQKIVDSLAREKSDQPEEKNKLQDEATMLQTEVQLASEAIDELQQQKVLLQEKVKTLDEELGKMKLNWNETLQQSSALKVETAKLKNCLKFLNVDIKNRARKSDCLKRELFEVSEGKQHAKKMNEYLQSVNQGLESKLSELGRAKSSLVQEQVKLLENLSALSGALTARGPAQGKNLQTDAGAEWRQGQTC